MKKSSKIIHWLPRIFCILAILFVSMFALDAFEPGLTVWQQLGAFLMHLIPSFILLAFFFIANKWEYIGGILFMAIGIGMSPFIYRHNHNINHFSVGQSLGVLLMINLPFVLVGTLFIVSHFMKKKENLKTYKEKK